MRTASKVVAALVMASALGGRILAVPPLGFAPPPYYGVFRELPITDIAPQGWLLEFLKRQKNGLGGHHAASGYPFDTCLWSGKIPKGGNPKGAIWGPYEQTAYLVDGIIRAGLLLHDEDLTGEARRNVQYVIEHARPNGLLGPDHIGPTQWPFVIFTRASMAEYQATGESKILDALRRHYLALPPTLKGDREVCTVEGLCWTYGQTGDKAMLDLALQTWAAHSDKFPAGAPKISGHGVTISELIKQPAILFLYTNDRDLLDRSIDNFRLVERDHLLVDGIPSSEEGVSGNAPEKTHETCVISDYTWSMGYMLMATGDAEWGDKIERGVFNAGLGAITKDFKAHEYFASPNQMIAANGTSPWKGEGSTRQSYRPGFDTECCSGNVHRFLPNYAARMWMDDGHGGLAATLYGPSTVRAKVGVNATPVTIEEQTNYPFEEAILFKMHPAGTVRFPLRLRIPRWANGASVAVNGERLGADATVGTFLTVERDFAEGDVVALKLSMKTMLEKPVPGGVSVSRGPVVYSLEIKEHWRKVENAPIGSEEFPAWEVTPARPWNYALSGRDVERRAKVRIRHVAGFPWTEYGAPVIIELPAHRLPGWKLDGNQNPPLPTDVRAEKKAEVVRLIPYGSTGLRVTVFPEIPESQASGGGSSR